MTIIQTHELTKRFGDLVANDTINLTVKKGEIKAIVGENGAGKSTLMNMLYGLLKPTSGTITIRGKRVDFDSPADAINLGIGMVHQHFKLVESLTVYENVLLGIELKRTVNRKNKPLSTPLIDRVRSIETIDQLIESYGFKLKATDRIRDLSIGAKQKVEILKMLYRDVDVLIFDEPTAVLTPQEIEAFFKTLKAMRAEGKTIILITHKLKEVMAVSDTVMVIKQGKVVGDLETAKTNAKDLAQRMVGRDVLLDIHKEPIDKKQANIIYRVENLSTHDEHKIDVVKNVSFDIRAGEIVGIAGVEGNGQTELVKLLTGMMVAPSGKVYLNDQDITNLWPDQLRHRGVAIIPEDRYTHGLCVEMKIYENLIAGYHDQRDVCRYGLFNMKAVKEKSLHHIEKYDIRLTDHTDLTSSLSGGNAQKIIIAREFESNPDVLIAAQPTRGVDIGAIEFIHQSLLDLASKENKAVLIVSSELSEIMNLSDRILVMFKGEIIGEVARKDATRMKLGRLMAGIKEDFAHA